MATNAMTSLLWFIAILVMIPVALWLLKRTPLGGAGNSELLRCVAALPLAANQRIVTIEVGEGEARRWLVLGVTAQSITTLHTMAPPTERAAPDTEPMPLTAFAQLMGRLRQDKGGQREH